MNNFNKVRNIIGKGTIFVKSFQHERYNFKNIIIKNKQSIIFGASVFTLSYIGYSQFNRISNDLFRKSFCENPFRKKVPFSYEWKNMPESVYKSDTTESADKIVEKPVDDINVVKEMKTEPLIFVTQSNANTVNDIPTEVPYLIIGAGIAGISAARAIRASDPFAKVLIINSECQSPGQHNEVYPPYRRILLSKFIWRRSEEHQKTLLDTSGDVKSNSLLYIEPDTFFVAPAHLNQLEYGGISLLNNTRVASINTRDSSVILEGSGQKITYKACLIATGSSPRRLKHLEISENTGRDLYKDGKVSYFRSLNDFRNLSENIRQLQMKENGGRVLIVGSGLLGTELTSSLGRLAKDQGKLEIIEVFKEKSHLYHLLPSELSLYIRRHMANNHTKFISEAEVVSVSEITDGPDSGRLNITMKSLSATNEDGLLNENVDRVVIAAGVKPDTSLSHEANLETDQMIGGFMVNAELQACEGVFVAGDACSFYDTTLGRRRRIEHWNHSEESGTIAGHNMAAFVLKTDKIMGFLNRIDRSKLATDILKPQIYDYRSSFNFKLSMYRTIEALGLIDSSLETKTFIAQDFFDNSTETDENAKENNDNNNQQQLASVGKLRDRLDMPGVVFYLQQKRVVGILLWNCDDDLVIESDGPSPLRTNVARKVLSERALLASDNELKTLAANFDLSFFVNSQIRVLEEYNGGRKEKPELVTVEH